MQRTNVVQLLPSKRQRKVLRECMLLSSCVYNMTNYEVRQAFFKKEAVPGFFALQRMIQQKDDYRMLGRSYGLPRIQIYAETNSARFKLIKSKTQEKVGLPKYLKNRKTNTTLPSYLVIDGCQYALGKRKVRIPLSRAMRKKYGLKRFEIAYNGVLRWKGEQKRGQIHEKDGKFYFHQAVEMPEPTQIGSDVYAGIDLGIKKLITVKTSDGEDKVIGSRRHYRQWCYYGRLIAAEQSKLDKAGRRTSRRLKGLFSIRTKWQDNLYDNLVAKAFKVLRRKNVSCVFIGDVSGIREGADWGRRGNGMLHNYWAYDSLYKRFENKAEEYGIREEMTDEVYSSQTCPICGVPDEKNKHDRIFVCEFCGYIDHRDVVGAGNIMVRGMCGLEESTHQGEAALSGGGSDAVA